MINRQDSVTVIDNFLPISFIDKIHQYVTSRYEEYAWRPNSHIWDPGLTIGSPSILLMDISEFKNELTDICSANLGLDATNGLTVPYPVFYDAPRGSFVNWHTDTTPLGISIYLNEEWRREWGGLFLYEDKDEIKGIVPRFNTAVVARPNISHCVTPVNLLAESHRYSVQLFMVEKESTK